MFEIAIIVIAVALLPIAVAVSLATLPWALLAAVIVAMVVLATLLVYTSPGLATAIFASIAIPLYLRNAGRNARKQQAAEQAALEQGHPHQCADGHWWQHTGPTSHGCAITEYSDDAIGFDGEWETRRYIGREDCPICTGREELLIRGPHSHDCFTCRGQWRHSGRCPSGAPICPWCIPVAYGGIALDDAVRGSHRHYCPRCFREWTHDAPPGAARASMCSAPHRAALPDCPGCAAVSVSATRRRNA
jgi:hypothetical protein